MGDVDYWKSEPCVCCFAFCCPCLLLGNNCYTCIREDARKSNYPLPLLEHCCFVFTCCLYLLLLPCCLCFLPIWWQRWSFRKHYTHDATKLQTCVDCLISFCPCLMPCTLVQHTQRVNN